MKKKIIIPVLLIIASVNFSKAQSVSADALPSGKYLQSVFVEGAGSGLGISGNFETRLHPDRNNGLGVRVGVGIIPADFDKYITLPLSINYFAGKKKSGFESGIGITTLYNLNPGNENFFMELDPDERHQILLFL